MDGLIVLLFILTPLTILLTVLFVYVSLGDVMAEVQNVAQEAVDAVVAQLVKAKGEVVAEIAALAAREPSLDLSALKAAAQSLDDVVADAPVVEEPVEEPTV